MGPARPPPAPPGLLVEAGWTPENRQRLESMIPARGVAVLDWDETCIHGDISETLLAILAADRGEDLVEAYQAECREDLRTAYVNLVHTLVAGRTEREARALALRALREGQAMGRLAIRETMRELVWALQRHEWDVWVITASPEVLVQAVAEQYGIPPGRVVGMRSVVGTDGRYLPRLHDPITYKEGKVLAFLSAAGGDPTFVAGDSRSDAPLMQRARYALLLDRGDDGLRTEAEARGWWIQPVEHLR